MTYILNVGRKSYPKQFYLPNRRDYIKTLKLEKLMVPFKVEIVTASILQF
jgi:hypothetical protein